MGLRKNANGDKQRELRQKKKKKRIVPIAIYRGRHPTYKRRRVERGSSRQPAAKEGTLSENWVTPREGERGGRHCQRKSSGKKGVNFLTLGVLHILAKGSLLPFS